MVSDDFRRIAVGMRGAVEGAHMDHPDFRANGRIFATLHGDKKWGMVKLTPDDQQELWKRIPGCSSRRRAHGDARDARPFGLRPPTRKWSATR